MFMEKNAKILLIDGSIRSNQDWQGILSSLKPESFDEILICSSAEVKSIHDFYEMPPYPDGQDFLLFAPNELTAHMIGKKLDKDKVDLVYLTTASAKGGSAKFLQDMKQHGFKVREHKVEKDRPLSEDFCTACRQSTASAMVFPKRTATIIAAKFRK